MSGEEEKSEMEGNEVEKVIKFAQSAKLMPPLSERPILIRCFTGFQQESRFKAAICKILASTRIGMNGNDPDSIKCEMISFRDVRDDKSIQEWTVKDFVDWLLGSHIHFIITHPHQGSKGFGWGVNDLLNELKRLKDHVGFPNGEKLFCPIFTQDKFVYLDALQEQERLETHVIPLSADDEQVVLTASAIISEYICIVCFEIYIDFLILFQCFHQSFLKMWSEYQVDYQASFLYEFIVLPEEICTIRRTGCCYNFCSECSKKELSFSKSRY